jgi:hypothetical protein
MIKDQIVSDGLRRLLKAPATREQICQATDEIKQRFKREMQGAGLFTRLVLWLRMRKAIRVATDKIAPSRGCYLKK